MNASISGLSFPGLTGIPLSSGDRQADATSCSFFLAVLGTLTSIGWLPQCPADRLVSGVWLFPPLWSGCFNRIWRFSHFKTLILFPTSGSLFGRQLNTWVLFGVFKKATDTFHCSIKTNFINSNDYICARRSIHVGQNMNRWLRIARWWLRSFDCRQPARRWHCLNCQQIPLVARLLTPPSWVMRLQGNHIRNGQSSNWFCIWDRWNVL